jgi:hypothetical protein
MNLKHELWQDDEGQSNICLAGPRGEGARKLAGSNAKLIWTTEAGSHFDAMTAYYDFMDWGTYRTDQPWDLNPILTTGLANGHTGLMPIIMLR